MSALSRFVLAAAAALAGLAACGAPPDAFPPACPKVAILRDGADLERFRGGGRDFLDTTLQGRVTRVDGGCKRDGARSVLTDVRIGIELSRGPAARGRTADIAYFVAVSQGERVLDKRVYPLRAEFPENTDRVILTGEDAELRLPVTKEQDASVYQVTVGFQLSPDELEWNRQRQSRRR